MPRLDGAQPRPQTTIFSEIFAQLSGRRRVLIVRPEVGVLDAGEASMLARMRSGFLLSFLLPFSVVACLPVQAQIHGVPASVTSFGFGGSDNPAPGVRASVTSLGPNGFGNSRPVFGNCCANFFFPVNSNPPLFFDGQFSGHQFSGRHHRHGDHSFFPLGVRAPRARNAEPPIKRGGARDLAPKTAASAKPTPSEPEEPLTTQPSTVLIF